MSIELALEDGAGVEYWQEEPETREGKQDWVVLVSFTVGRDEWDAMPEADPILGALRMAEDVVSRLKAEAFNRGMKKWAR